MSEQLSKEAIALLTSNISNMDKTSFFAQLLDKDNNQVSTTNFFIIITTIIGIVLLLVPIFILVLEAWYNHTITTDLNGVAAYIGSVVMMFASVGITKAWTNYSDAKVEIAKHKRTAQEFGCDTSYADKYNTDNEDNNETDSTQNELD